MEQEGVRVKIRDKIGRRVVLLTVGKWWKVDGVDIPRLQWTV